MFYKTNPKDAAKTTKKPDLSVDKTGFKTMKSLC
jgi:hypothetical protein